MIRALAAAGMVLAMSVLPLVDRDDIDDPTPKQIEASVDAYSTDGSVERLVQESTDADQALVVGSDVLFAYGSADLDPGAQAALEGLIADLPPAAALTVDGHTDSRGGDAVNLPLSQARAQAVADLIATARPDVSLTVQGRGSSKPLADEYPGGDPDYEAMAQNRRVEVRVTG